MILLEVLFPALFLISMGCAIKGGKLKRSNPGFVFLSTMVALGDIISFAVINVYDAKSASAVLLPYYLIHAWAYFSFLLAVVMIDRYKKYTEIVIPAAIVCIYQSYLVIIQKFGARIFSFQKRIYFRKAFWVAVDDSKNTGLFYSFRSYRICLLIVAALTIIVMIDCIRRSHRIFKPRYYAIIGIIVTAVLIEIIVQNFAFPVWIPCIAYNALPPVGLYLTGSFAENVLTEWSLDCFANDMSDGLVLYDKYDELIHINDMVKNTLEENLLEDFKDKKKLEAWIEEQRDEDNRGILMYRRGDEDHYYKVTVRSLGDAGPAIGTLYILHDTTDSVNRIMAVEKTNEELERVSRMKSDFLANMSHEIRTPMNAVIGMAELALREKDSPQLTEYLLQIQSSGSNLLNIINDILDYSKIESGKMEIIEEDYHPFEEISDIANVLATRIGDKPLEFFTIAESYMPRTLRGDAMRIRQVLINIANNAIKFTPAGLVRIQVKCEPLSEDMINITYHVVDTGIGIKKEDLDKLYVSFQQLDSRRNRSVEGTGLGLAISKKIVEAMNGTIGVESEYGKGSDFWFTIPQKVVDNTNEIYVENASGKHSFVLNEKDDMVMMFVKEMENLGVQGTVIHSLEEYSPSGGKDFLFIENERYNDEIRAFLDGHKGVTGIILEDLASEFVPDRENLEIMRKPETTMHMVQVLNEKYDEIRSIDEDDVYRIDYSAPDARILIVDDNNINLTIAKGLIAPIKAQIDTADGGQEAVDKVKANEYDIVLMDHMMPEVDGVDATTKIRTEGDSIHQPVIIAVSANVMEEAKKLFAGCGMDDFVAKPIEVRALMTAIKKWLPAEMIMEPVETEMEETEDSAAGGGAKVQCEGVDTETAIRALGSAALYDEIAEEYCRSGPDKMQNIREAFENEDWENYTIRVHALKSSSRQIGAMALGDMAEALENAGNARDIEKIMSDTEGTLAEFQRILDGLGVYYVNEDADEGDKPLIDSETLQGFIEKLKTACDELDLDGLDEIDAGLKEYSYGEDMSGKIAELRKAIANIDTEKCMEIAESLET
ncbi:MAG: response regulator [Lachnospiraceae bacterium]|nr:response regulator [Lachnospiraceae bacterium]